ncbi:MAG: hypothetical protein ACI3ZR_04645 [bacterium]
MSGHIAEIILSLSCVLSTGLAIKILDDYLDREIDELAGKDTFVQFFQQSILPYGLLFLAFGLTLEPKLGGSLFLASYAVGMFKQQEQIYPCKLSGWQEIVLSCFLGSFLYGWFDFLSALSIIFFVQLLDDFYDYKIEKETDKNNYFRQYDKITVFCLLVMFASLSVFLDLVKLLLVLGVTPFIICLSEKRKEPRKMVVSFLILLLCLGFLIGYFVGKSVT